MHGLMRPSSAQVRQEQEEHVHKIQLGRGRSLSTSSSSDDKYPKVSFMIRLLSVKIIDVTFSLSQTIDEVKSEIKAQFGLSPSQYILKAGYKTLAQDTCSLADYDIQESSTLDIVP